MIPDTFNPTNIVDTCAVWNLIGADTLFRTARRCVKGISFIITPTVFYECFVKQGASPPSADRESLRERLRGHIKGGRVTQVGMSIEDLQETVDFARRRGLEKRLGQGEFSCAALVRRLGHAAVLTDNRRDFNAIKVLVDERLQTTPRLLGWLYCEGHLTDTDVAEVVREHQASGGHVAEHYRRAHTMACEKRLVQQMARAAQNPAGA